MQRRGRSIYGRLILKIKIVFSKIIVLRLKSRAMARHLELVQITEAYHAGVDKISSIHKQFFACLPSAGEAPSLPFRSIIHSLTHSRRRKHAARAWERAGFWVGWDLSVDLQRKTSGRSNEMDIVSGEGSKAALDDTSNSSLRVPRFFPRSCQRHGVVKGASVLGQRDFFILVLSSSIHLASLMNPFL